MRDITPLGSAGAPSLDHHPMSLFERLDDMVECGLTALIGVAAAALYIAIAELTAGPEPVGLFPALCHTVLESPFLTQVPFIGLTLPFHSLQKKREIDAWADAGWYREGFEPKHHDLRHLRCVSRQAIAAHRKNTGAAEVEHTTERSCPPHAGGTLIAVERPTRQPMLPRAAYFPSETHQTTESNP